MQPAKALLIHVSGKVQGVWFRKYTAEAAERLGISGWVRNEADGSVLIHAEAQAADLEAFVAWCHEGSPLSVVENVTIRETQPQQSAGFRIDRENAG